MIGGQPSLARSDIHFLLSNPRRRHALDYLRRAGAPTSVRELSEHVASTETGESPAPRPIRETVYVSLVQTHLPALAEVGAIEYDPDHQRVTALDASRDIHVYMEVVTGVGITWDEYYRYLGILALLVVLAVQLATPVVSMVETLVWVTVFLGIYAVSIVYQFRYAATPIQRWWRRHRPE